MTKNTLDTTPCIPFDNKIERTHRFGLFKTNKESFESNQSLPISTQIYYENYSIKDNNNCENEKSKDTFFYSFNNTNSLSWDSNLEFYSGIESTNYVTSSQTCFKSNLNDISNEYSSKKCHILSQSESKFMNNKLKNKLEINSSNFDQINMKFKNQVTSTQAFQNYNKDNGNF